VLAWGLNDIGELGNGTVSEPSNPARVPVRTSLPPGARIRAVSAGCNMALAVTSQGQVLGWGTNRDGRLGLGPGAPRHSLVPVKVQIPAGNKITAVRAGCFHALALTSTGKVLAWGRNIIGAVGTGRATEAPVLAPTRVHLPRGTRVTAIAASYNTSMALTASGQVWTWGANQFGQLGNGTIGISKFSPVPVHVHLPPGVKGAALAMGTAIDFVVTRSGQIYAWGAGGGDLGIGRDRGHVIRPVRVQLPAGTRVASMAAGCGFALARTTAGAVLGWGDNTSGQLTFPTATEADRPRLITALSGVRVTALGASCESALARTANGRMLAWGLNGFGELGTGSTAQISRTPTPVALPHGFTVLRIGSGSQAHGSYALGH
jgi:alpha-tubulin suppressor-like RCC1 family protein